MGNSDIFLISFISVLLRFGIVYLLFVFAFEVSFAFLTMDEALAYEYCR